MSESPGADPIGAGDRTEAEPEAPRPPPSPLRWLDWRLIRTALAIQAVFYAYGTQAYQVLADAPIGGFEQWLGIWNRWDAVHYVNLARNGYQATGDDRLLIIFYPLFPWVTRAAAVLLGNYVVSALVVAGVATIAAALLLQELVKLDAPPAFAERAAWFMLVFPGSAALRLPYSEALLLALVLGSFLAARRDRWALAGALGALACLCRVNGVVLVPALAAEALSQLRQSRRWRWQWLWIGLVGLGVLGFLALNYSVHGDPWKFLTFRREHWHQNLAWPWVGLRAKLGLAWNGVGEQGAIQGVQDLFFAGLGLVGAAWACVALRPAYAVWMVAHWLMFTSTGHIIGLSRFTLVMFPLFFLFARLSAHRAWHAAITAWSLLFLALFTGLYVRGHWVF